MSEVTRILSAIQPGDPHAAELTWVVQARGFGASVLGGLLATFYRSNLEKAIPLLVAEMNACSAS